MSAAVEAATRALTAATLPIGATGLFGPFVIAGFSSARGPLRIHKILGGL